MSRQDDDKFYIMASTNAHIGEALETISQPVHGLPMQTPLRYLITALISRLVSIALTMTSLFHKRSR